MVRGAPRQDEAPCQVGLEGARGVRPPAGREWPRQARGVGAAHVPEAAAAAAAAAVVVARRLLARRVPARRSARAAPPGGMVDRLAPLPRRRTRDGVLWADGAAAPRAVRRAAAVLALLPDERRRMAARHTDGRLEAGGGGEPLVGRARRRAAVGGGPLRPRRSTARRGRDAVRGGAWRVGRRHLAARQV